MLALALSVATGCKSPERPRPPGAAAQTIATARPGQALRGVAASGSRLVGAFASTSGSESVILAWDNGKDALEVPVAGTVGDVIVAGDLIVTATSATGALRVPPDTSLALRGDPAGVLLGIDPRPASPQQRWALPFDSTEWALISSLAPLGADVIVGGSFGGTLRVGDKVVTSAGGSDGFIARVTASGTIQWLVRIGGAGADNVAGVATTAQRVVLAGTFTAGADLLGQPLTAHDERSPFGDAFVAELDPRGARRWTATFGGRADDAVAGVTIAGERVVVAASVRDVVSVGSTNHVTSGASDGLVVWYGDEGELGASVLLGGLDFDGLRAITAVGDLAVVGGFFSGRINLADRELAAGGGDDSFLAALDPSGTVVASWHVKGPGREEITDLGAVPGGFVAGVAHTAGAAIEGASLPAPKDPGSGAALIVRGL